MKKKYYDEGLKFKAKQAKIVLVVSLLLIVFLGFYFYSKKTEDLFHYYFFLAMFCIPLLTIIFKTYKLNRSYEKFGGTYIELDPDPGSIGGHLGGILSLQIGAIKNADELAHLKIEMECINNYAISSGSLQRAEEVLLKMTGVPKEYNQRTDINGEHFLTIPFLFNVPKNFPATKLNDESKIIWKISLRNDCPLFNHLDLSFEVPVNIDVQLSQLKVAPFNEIDRKEENEYVSKRELEQLSIALQKSSIKRTHEKNVLTYYFPNFRSKTLSFIFFLTSVVLFSILVSTGFQLVLLFMNLFFTLVFLIITFNSFRLEVDQKNIKTTRTIMLFYKRVQVRPIDQLKIIDTLLSYTVDKGRDVLHYFKIKGTFSDGNQLTLTEAIPHKQNAEVMKNEILAFSQQK